MKIYTLLLSVLFGVAANAAESREDGTWEFFATLKSASDEPISVRIITGPWEASEHKIEKKVGNKWKVIPKQESTDSEDHVDYRIDGQESINGADGFRWPTREVKMFVVRWGNKTINVPRKHWRDYYSLLLYTVDETKKNDEIGGCWTKASLDDKTGDLVVVSNGGGGAGWYRVTWRIRPDGTITDKAEGSGD